MTIRLVSRTPEIDTETDTKCPFTVHQFVKGGRILDENLTEVAQGDFIDLVLYHSTSIDNIDLYVTREGNTIFLEEDFH